MKRGSVMILSIVGFIILVFVVYYVASLNKSEHFIWNESYIEASEQPFGTSVFSEILEHHFDGNKFEKVNNDLAKKLSNADGKHKNYVFIGQVPFYTDSVFELLENFVKNGNDAFIALKEMPELLSTEILLQNNIATPQDTIYYLDNNGDSVYYLQDAYVEDKGAFSYFTAKDVALNFLDAPFRKDSGYHFQIEIEEEVIQYEWLFFLPEYKNSIKNCNAIGSIYSSNFCDMIQVPYGKGNFYIHSNPVVFSNYFQIQKDKVEYTSKVLSYLTPGDIIWDEYSKTTYNNNNPQNDNQQEGPLRFILSQNSLRWAWYTMLIGLLVFVFFRTRRTQQHIPILEPNENKSLEFVQTIGRMYYLRKNHKQLAQQKIKLFLNFIYEKYQINTHILDEAFIEKLKMKSEISADTIKNIFKHAKYIENTDQVTADDLIQLHTQLDNFYKNCK